MKKPLIRRWRADGIFRKNERGVTMVLVAISMVAVIAMAALSIDVVTLYLAREEAQRSADDAALAAAKIISVSGLTGDPANAQGNWGAICGPDDGVNGLATRTAKAVANQDTVGSQMATTINVTYSAGTGGAIGAGTNDCSTLSSTAFGVNPLVTVQLTRSSLPTFFSRIWGYTGNSISATATAETYNPSNSGNVGNQATGTIIPVQPRCVKPWVVPNQDPYKTPGCTSGTCSPFVGLADGSIQNPGMSIGGGGATGTVGENFWLVSDCNHQTPGTCNLRASPPVANYPKGGHRSIENPPNLLYVPGQVGTPVLAVPSSCAGDQYQDAIAGCDQPTNYSCGFPPASATTPNAVDTTIYPANDTTTAVQCLTHQSNPGDVAASSGQDYLNSSTFGAPSAYPYQIFAGGSNPTGLSGTTVSNSSSIVSLPIYDQTTTPIASGTKTEVTFVGFLQVFINAVDQYGNINVTVLNVAGCSNGSGAPVGTAVVGNSPVPVRLITPP